MELPKRIGPGTAANMMLKVLTILREYTVEELREIVRKEKARAPSRGRVSRLDEKKIDDIVRRITGCRDL